MPRRQDLKSICLIGSGPIVIGQACEFDYAGCQALKVLREDGFRTIVVNSNPATIMTDPGFADAHLPRAARPRGRRRRARPRAARRAAADARRPDRAQPRDRARRRGHPATTLGVELLGAPVDVIRRAEDRELFRDAVQSCGLAVPSSRIVTSARRPRRHRRARRRPAGIHARRPRRRLRLECGRAARPGRARPAREPDRPGAGRGVGQGLGRVRARGDPRPARQRRHRLLDREPRPDGRAHGRLRHGRAAADALGRGLSGASRRRDRRHPRCRGRDRWLQHPVRAQPRDRRDPGDRDEPARLALVGAGVEGDRLSDREGRRQARRWLHARRDPERPDEDDAGQLRADARLRRRQVPALRLREVPRCGHDAGYADEVGRRGDGDRPHLPGGVLEGLVEPRARCGCGDAVGGARRPSGRPAPLVPARAGAAAHGRAAAGRARLPPGRLLRRRGRRRLELLLLDPRRGRRAGADDRQATRRHPRLRPEPDRPGDRVRLLLRPRSAELPRPRLRGDHGQLQPRDGLDRLRHVRPALLRATRRRARARGLRAGAARGCRDPVRGPDAAQARAGDRGGRVQGARNPVRGGRPGRGPRAFRAAAGRARRSLPGVGDRRRAARRRS